ncbi:MAG TPA: sugar phosphate nucleotidyltransferase, partial [Polyangiaceae bacterium]|nr:sugar phosphate nucleotidyltransferase [Polyangiaceae bacterium]
ASVRRILPICPAEHIIIVTAQHLIEPMRAALPDLPARNFLAEPAARNTAPCIGWANSTIRRRDREATIMVLPSDHFIGDEPGFRATLEKAALASQTHSIATIGITPARPETGYGYIEKGAPAGGSAFAVERFIEKPDLARAEAFVASGKHLWNSGMFFFGVHAMTDLIAEHLPLLARGLERLDRAAALGDEPAEVEKVFPSLPSISIDHGVMEKAASVAVVPGEFGWSDVGSWQSAWELAPKDAQGNAAPSETVFVDARGNLVRDLRSDKSRVIALVGVHDMAVVVTDDELLVIPRERAQDVKKALEIVESRAGKS